MGTFFLWPARDIRVHDDFFKDDVELAFDSGISNVKRTRSHVAQLLFLL
jgi:hypothetical protein